MKNRITFLTLILAVVTIMSCITSCNPSTLCSGEPSGPKPCNPNEAAEQITFDYKKTDILNSVIDDADVTYVPEEIIFEVSVNNSSGFRIEQLHGILTVCDANGQFICAVNTPTQGWTDSGGIDHKTFFMTAQGLSSMTINELFCTHGSDLQVTFEITNVSFRQYDRYGEYEAVQATKLPPKKNANDTGHEMNYRIGRNEEEFRLAAKIFKNGGYEQSLTIFEELLQNAKANSGYGWAADIIKYCQPYADKCHEILGK